MTSRQTQRSVPGQAMGGNENVPPASHLDYVYNKQKTINAAKSMSSMSSTSTMQAGPRRVALTDVVNLNKPVASGKDGLKNAHPKPLNTRASVHSLSLGGTQAVKPIPVLTNGSGLAVVRNVNTKKTAVYQDADPLQQAPAHAAAYLESEAHSISQESVYSESEIDVVYEDAVEQLLGSKPAGRPMSPGTLKSLGAIMPSDDMMENLSDVSDLSDEAHYTVTQTADLGPIPAPTFTARIRKELRDARRFVVETETVEELEEEMQDIGMVREYSDDIFAYMVELEDTLKPDPHYMDNQTELRWPMRSVLIDWVVQVHARFHLYPETLHLTINLIDRFLSKKVVSLGKLQLVGATALLIASKYEEVNVPSVREIVYMVDEGYQAEEIIKAEKYMSNLLDWKLGYPSPLNYLRRTSKADDYDEKIRTVAKYLIEVAMMDERFVACRSSLVAAGSHCFARLILGAGGWSKAHVHYSGYTVELLMNFMYNLHHCLSDPSKHHPAVFEKYKESRFEPATTINHLMVDFILP